MKLTISLLLIIAALFAFLALSIKDSIKKSREKNAEIARLKDRNICLENLLTEYKVRIAEYEELKNKAHSGTSDDNFNASLELLQKQAQSGRKRNK